MSKGIFIPDITVEMIRRAPLEAVETLLVEGEMHDVDMPKWIPCSERLPSKSDHKDDMVLVCYGNGSVRFNTCKNGQWCQGNPLAWMPLPEGWKGEE